MSSGTTFWCTSGNSAVMGMFCVDSSAMLSCCEVSTISGETILERHFDPILSLEAVTSALREQVLWEESQGIIRNLPHAKASTSQSMAQQVELNWYELVLNLNSYPSYPQPFISWIGNDWLSNVIHNKKDPWPWPAMACRKVSCSFDSSKMRWSSRRTSGCKTCARTEEMGRMGPFDTKR